MHPTTIDKQCQPALIHEGGCSIAQLLLCQLLLCVMVGATAAALLGCDRTGSIRVRRVDVEVDARRRLVTLGSGVTTLTDVSC